MNYIIVSLLIYKIWFNTNCVLSFCSYKLMLESSLQCSVRVLRKFVMYYIFKITRTTENRLSLKMPNHVTPTYAQWMTKSVNSGIFVWEHFCFVFNGLITSDLGHSNCHNTYWCYKIRISKESIADWLTALVKCGPNRQSDTVRQKDPEWILVLTSN